MMSPAKIWRNFKRKRATGEGFTMIEVVIATSLFVIVGMIGVMVFVNVIRVQRRVTLENAIYEDARFMMERIAREVRQNTIDYEEYWRVVRGGVYGENYGCYAQQFYHPRFDGFGALCNNGLDAATNPGCVINKNTLDINTGQNPYVQPGVDATDSSAVCEDNGVNDCSGPPDSSFEQSELYLINARGDSKTYLARKKINTTAGGDDEFAVAMLKLDGDDTNTDGIHEKWEDGGDYDDFCAEGFDCVSLTESLGANLADPNAGEVYAGFVPLTPFRTTVTQLKFYIAPMEDPRKAFAETDPAAGIQQQPHVTVVMTVQPAESELINFSVDPPPTVTLQTTISSRVYNEVKSYLGVDAC